jgi:4-hydroxybenzoate polyprenyltransferase
MAERVRLARTLVHALRPHHWVKNLLVFVPILAAHRWHEPQLWASAGLAFAAFCLCSSAIYLANDLLDVDDDRAHPLKRHRPLASGRLSPRQALTLAGVLAVPALGLALASGAIWLVAGYALGSLAYSARLKTLPGIDIAGLVGLYSLRLLAGGAATGIAVSGWLLSYAACIFASLALAKRAAELGGVAAGDLPLPGRRGYRMQDRKPLTALGILAAVGSIGVLLAYFGDAEARTLYAQPYWLLAGGGVVLVWLLRVWRLVSRGQLHSDPIVFALRDPASLAAGLLVLAVFALAAA